MTDRFKRYVKRVAEFCRDETFHGEYKQHIRFESSDADTTESCHSRTKAAVNINCVYLYMTIMVYPQMFADFDSGNYKEVAEDILHEICHAFIAPVTDYFMWDVCQSQKSMVEDIVERQTSRVCNCISGLLPKDWWRELLDKEETDSAVAQ